MQIQEYGKGSVRSYLQELTLLFKHYNDLKVEDLRQEHIEKYLIFIKENHKVGRTKCRSVAQSCSFFFKKVMPSNGAMQKAGFQSGRFTAHTLRHSFATHMLNQGNNIHVIKTLLGHSKLETTMVYLHLQHHTQLGIVSPLEKLDDGTTAN